MMGQTREQKIIKQVTGKGGQVQKQNPIMTGMFLPNHSGIHEKMIASNSKIYGDLYIVGRGKELEEHEENSNAIILEPYETGTAAGATSPRCSLVFNPEKRAISADAGSNHAGDIIWQAHKYHEGGTLHQHLSLYTTRADGDTRKRLDIQYLKDIADFDIQYCDVSLDANSSLTLKAETTAGFLKNDASGVVSGGNSILDLTYPVGAVYISVSSTSPATLFGGTWSSFGAGKVLVGLDSGDADFDTVEETGGEKTHTLTEAELASHGHGLNALGFPSGVIKTINYSAVPVGSGGSTASRISSTTKLTTSDNAGSGSAHNNVQPYIVVYMWKRTA